MMLDPVVSFFTKIFYWIGRGIGKVIAWLLWPFITFRNWLRGKGWFIKIKLTDPSQLDGLMDEAGYAAFAAGQS